MRFATELKFLLSVLFLCLIFTACGSKGLFNHYDNQSENSVLSGAMAITAFSILGVDGIINDQEKTISVILPDGTDVTFLVASFTTTGASVEVSHVTQISGISGNDFSYPVVYTVKAENSFSVDYTVTAATPSGLKAITAFSILGIAGKIDESGKKISAVVPYGTDISGLVASFTATGASLDIGGATQISGTTRYDFTYPVVYTVTAEDSSRVNYTVTVTIAEYLYVINYSSNTVTYFDAKTGAYINGTLENSSFATGYAPLGVAVNSRANILYVTNVKPSVTYFNATTGKYLFGTRTNSSFTTGSHPAEVAVNSTENILYVSNFNSNTVTYLNASTGAYLNGTLENSSFTTGSNPLGLAVNSAENILYVANYGSNTVTYLNATTGAYINGTLENSSFAAGTYPYGAAINFTENILYVTNSGSDTKSDTVTYFNAITGEYLNGTMANSSFTIGETPRQVAVNSAVNILYVANSSSDTVTCLNAKTGAYINGILDNSSFTTGSVPDAVAVNPGANILYVANNYSNTVTFFNATTGAYLNGTLENSSFATGDFPGGVAYVGQ